MRLVLALLRWCRRFAALLVFVAMLAANVATLTVGSVSALASAALGSVGVTTVAASEAAERASRRAAARQAARRASGIVRRGAARNVGAVAAESLPWIGAAAAVGFTAAEIADACLIMEELETLDRELAPEGGAEAVAQDRARVCGLTVPSAQEVEEAVREAPGKVWEKAGRVARAFGGLRD